MTTTSRVAKPLQNIHIEIGVIHNGPTYEPGDLVRLPGLDSEFVVMHVDGDCVVVQKV